MARRKKRNGNTASENTANKKTNKVVVSTMIIFSLLFLVMGGYYAYFLYFKSEIIANNEYNARYKAFSEIVVRGKIVSNSGEVLAYTKTDDDGKETRVYPFGDLFAHAVGYYDNGQTGVEDAFNYQLLTSEVSGVEELKNEFTGEKSIGNTVVTTLDRTLQETAYDALGKNDGAVVCIDAKSGEILSLVSKPTFDPNNIRDLWDEFLSEDNESTALLNRVTQGLYTPGSTFKIFTALEYIKENNGSDDFSYYCGGTGYFDGFNIRCYGGSAHGSENLENAFAHSCNGAFATMGLGLDINKFKNRLEGKLLFNTQLPLDIKTSESEFNLTSDDGDFDIAQTAIGQGKTLVTPIHMAMIAQAISNNGVLLTPYIVDHVESVNGDIVEEHEITEYGRLMSSSESDLLMSYMKAVVSYGTAKSLNNDKYEAYGKTGTAQLNDATDNVNSWFVGGANKDDENIVVAVVIENVEEGSAIASDVAKKVFDQYYK